MCFEFRQPLKSWRHDEFEIQMCFCQMFSTGAGTFSIALACLDFLFRLRLDLVGQRLVGVAQFTELYK